MKGYESSIMARRAANEELLAGLKVQVKIRLLCVLDNGFLFWCTQQVDNPATCTSFTSGCVL